MRESFRLHNAALARSPHPTRMNSLVSNAICRVRAVGLVIVLFTFRDFGSRALLTLLLPAMLLLVSASAVGPMPREL